MKKHKHHIIPKHDGGSDDPSNIIELTIEEHAEAHRRLYEKHGKEEDEIAWKALSQQITLNEAQIRAHKMGAKRGGINAHENYDFGPVRSKHMKERIEKHGHAFLGITKDQRIQNAKKARASISPEGLRASIDAMNKKVSGSTWWNNGKINKRVSIRPGLEWEKGILKK